MVAGHSLLEYECISSAQRNKHSGPGNSYSSPKCECPGFLTHSLSSMAGLTRKGVVAQPIEERMRRKAFTVCRRLAQSLCIALGLRLTSVDGKRPGKYAIEATASLSNFVWASISIFLVFLLMDHVHTGQSISFLCPVLGHDHEMEKTGVSGTCRSSVT